MRDSYEFINASYDVIHDSYDVIRDSYRILDSYASPIRFDVMHVISFTSPMSS